MSAESPIEDYFREADAWDADRSAQFRRAASTAWWVAGAACACATTLGIALTVLLPLKRVDPFLVRVDNSTGIVDVVPVYTGQAAPEEAVTRYFLSHYVMVCERFNFATAESDYEECGAFHSAERNQSWYAAWTPTNPSSPLNVHRDGSSVRAQVSSVSFLSGAGGSSELAQVRYLKVERRGPGGVELTTHWIASVRYAYAAPSSDPKMRRWNPLGFRILDFRPEPETVAETPPGKESQ